MFRIDDVSLKYVAGVTSYSISTSSNPSSGGTTSGGGTYSSGTSTTVIATPNSGYSFVNWTENGSSVSTNASYQFTVTANRTLVANFTQNTTYYDISTSSNPTAGGTTGGGGSFQPNATATVTATPNSGYSFTNWTESGNIVSTSASYQFTVTANRTLVANFTQNSIASITVNSPNGGENLNAGSIYNIIVSNSSNITQIDFYYSSDNGINWYYISSTNATSTTTTYPWLVNYVATKFGLIKAVGHYSGNNVSDVSNNVFTINVGCIQTTDDYPYGNNCNFACNTNHQTDYWDFDKFTCTSWVAWKINQEFGYSNTSGPYIFTDTQILGHSIPPLSNALFWNSKLTGSPFYFKSDKIPTVGSIGWYDSKPGTTDGHVTFVNCVTIIGTDTIVTLTEYNGGGLDSVNNPSCDYGTRNIYLSLGDTGGNRIPSKYIHIEAGGGGSGSGINELLSELKNKVSVFPNPAIDNITIETSSITNHQIIFIYNTQGQLIVQQPMQQTKINIDISGFEKGMYFIEVKTENGIAINKFVKL